MQNCKKVTLRLRHCKHGKMAYYLDYYPPYRDKKTMKTIRHEYGSSDISRDAAIMQCI